jgi:photosystem II stability/assembly factor-like uncharacterized protein
MKKPLLRIALFVVGLSTGLPGYAFKDPLELPAIQAPKAAKALSLNVASRGNHVLTVGERGIILKRDFAAANSAQGVTDNEGKVWVQAKVPVSVNLTGVEFVTDSVAFVVGHDGVVLKSTDAGSSWVKVFDGIKANQQVVAAAKKKMDDMQSRYDAAKASDQEKMNEALEAAIFAFEDAEAGARFGPARPLLDVWFKDANTGWVVGSYGQIFETTDGGANWLLIADRLDNPDFRHYNGLYGDDTGLMLISGEAGRIYISSDFGASWKRSETGYNGHFYGTVVSRNETGQPIVFAYGFGGNVYRLGAGAQAWWKLNSPSKESFVKGLNIGKNVLFVDQKGRLVSTDETGTVLKMASAAEGKPVTGMAIVGNTMVLSGQNGPRTLPLPR